MKTHYKLEGTPNSPVLIFSNSLGANYHMWDDLVPLLLPYFRVLRYDTRGHGHSTATEGEYSIELLAKDVIQLADELGINQFAFCGLSMGGLIGQYLGIHYSNRLTHLVLSNTGAKIGDEARWTERAEKIAANGTGSMANDFMQRWFSDDFIANHKSKIAEMKLMVNRSSDAGYISCCAAIRDADFRNELGKIPVPTLVITGDEDPVTNVDQAEFLADRIPNSHLFVMTGTKHLCATERPVDYAHKLIDFLVGSSVEERGMHIRRTVLGAAHVEKANSKKNDFNSDFQEFITDYAWGEIWSRPGITKSQRSYITLAMLIALNRKDEFKMHVKAAFHNGLNKEEIKEIIMHASIYCGLPAANEAIHSAEEVFNHLGK